MKSLVRLILTVVILAGVGGGLFATRDRWLPLLRRGAPAVAAPNKPAPPEKVEVLELSPEARRNLGLVIKPLKLQTYWRTIQLPGTIIDRPGWSDRGITSPAVAVVSAIHAYPGDTVRPGDKLFSLHVFSEYLQNTQSELFKATRETELIGEQYKRIKAAADSGAVPAARAIELENQLRRQNAAIQAFRQDLLTRGFSPAQIASVTEGKFVSTIEVVAPPPVTNDSPAAASASLVAVPEQAESSPLIDRATNGPAYEVEALKVDLGQQVQAGQLLCSLANHHTLYIEGHAFKNESPALARAAQLNWPVRIEFAEDDATGWPALDQAFRIRHLANAIDPASRTFSFYIPLGNQSRGYEKDGKTFVVWRFRPGQRVRLHVPVEEFQDVFVLPAAGVVRDGPEAYVFRQNGDLFNRKSVHVLHEDRLDIVLGQDSQVLPGFYVAQNGAASLNRVLKAQAASGVPAGIHVHADGTTHGAH